MRDLNKKIAHVELPDNLKRMPISDEGYPIPWFVPTVNGKPDFRAMDGEKFKIAVRLKRCWMCGQPTGVHLCFAIGPMCMITRTIAEPPSHYRCLRAAVEMCPFLTQPKMRRNEVDLPEHRHIAGHGIMRNPGVTALWITREYKMFRPPNGGVLFELGAPERIEFYAEGRPATRAEILHSIETGLPLLQKIAADEGPDAEAALAKSIAKGMTLVPAEERVAS
jgi:hypothetical protein